MGRGLRRRSYALNDEGYFEPEYANVYGIPFQFIASDRPVKDPLPPKPVQEVAALEGREHLRITFPKLDGYRVEIPDEEIELDLTDTPSFPIGPSTVPTWVALDPVVGQRELEEGDPGKYRPQEVAFALARRILDTRFTGAGDRRPWLFPRLASLCRQWIDERVQVAPDHSLGYLMTITEAQALAAEAVWNAIVRYPDSRRERLRPMLNRFDADGSTADVYFHTRKATVAAEKSEVSHVTLDGADGNTWEQLLASELELSREVDAYVKNDHLGFVVPYLHKGRTPRLLARLPGAAARAGRRPARPDADHRGVRQPQEPGVDRGQGRHGPEPVVRRGEQPRRLRPLGLHRADKPAGVSVRAPAGNRSPVRR